MRESILLPSSSSQTWTTMVAPVAIARCSQQTLCGSFLLPSLSPDRSKGSVWSAAHQLPFGAGVWTKPTHRLCPLSFCAAADVLTISSTTAIRFACCDHSLGMERSREHCPLRIAVSPVEQRRDREKCSPLGVRARKLRLGWRIPSTDGEYHAPQRPRRYTPRPIV